MHLKIPPIVILLIAGILMYVLAYFLPVGFFDFTGRFYLMYILFGLSSIIAVTSILKFLKNKTTINPVKLEGVSSLVITGIYSFTRNPMYLAMLLLLLVWALYLGNAFNAVLAALFVSYMNKFQIIPEEKALLELFGKEYKNYKISVRRWF
ncbi:isoprenylcysteine carboxylmethyltransferase family protein [Cellulophaga sp. HaHaR_3_176]|uniref:methyltransferase family protein n=1 Tax=Cellulophaga sp. HaHaR_3_176 TaxID=1942464 RepID=UPI001C1F9E54|nr:isoprenylcysteine carboxylmethyltransferase family protein [Cellulophaga sp. HaHaR_3_176]QWX82602.1 isoprenylcysteine carboxylmethyltransferase family protein [Cellulophaga sp. HaHaR_3_176]